MSLAINYTHSAQFRSAGYVPFTVSNGTSSTEYGAVRQYGNFSFVRMYEAGHTVPYYQPLASLELFKRVIGNKNLADGTLDLPNNYGTGGDSIATHTEAFVPLPSSYTVSDYVSHPSLSASKVGAASSSAGATVTAATTGATKTGTATPSQSSSAGERRVHMFWRFNWS